jgi:hypothetical protein
MWRFINEAVTETLVIALAVIMLDKLLYVLRSPASPKRIMRSKHDSLIVQANLSA